MWTSHYRNYNNLKQRSEGHYSSVLQTLQLGRWIVKPNVKVPQHGEARRLHHTVQYSLLQSPHFDIFILFA